MSEKGQRKLTEAEKNRLQHFEQLSEKMQAEGYQRTFLTVSAVRANIIGSLYGSLLSLPFIIVFFAMSRDGISVPDGSFNTIWILFMAILIVLIVVHELIHGVTWSLFTENHFRDIEFGVIWQMLTPYCTCRQPLRKGQYMTGLLMPCLLLGIIPSVVSWFTHSLLGIAVGAFMIIGAGGDLLIGSMILRHKTKADAVYVDHPTECGLAVFEK